MAAIRIIFTTGLLLCCSVLCREASQNPPHAESYPARVVEQGRASYLALKNLSDSERSAPITLMRVASLLFKSHRQHLGQCHTRVLDDLPTHCAEMSPTAFTVIGLRNKHCGLRSSLEKAARPWCDLDSYDACIKSGGGWSQADVDHALTHGMLLCAWLQNRRLVDSVGDEIMARVEEVLLGVARVTDQLSRSVRGIHESVERAATDLEASVERLTREAIERLERNVSVAVGVVESTVGVLQRNMTRILSEAHESIEAAITSIASVVGGRSWPLYFVELTLGSGAAAWAKTLLENWPPVGLALLVVSFILGTKLLATVGTFAKGLFRFALTPLTGSSD